MDKLNGSQLFLAGTIMAKISEETKKGLEDNVDKDTQKAMNFVITKLDEITQEIAAEVLNQTIERIKELNKLINED